MMSGDESAWLDDIIHRRDGYEAAAVDAFAERLMRLARSRLPAQLRARVDPEDIVQSVFRSFFVRHAADRFSFGEAGDVWRLLAAITWRKVQRTIRYHQQLERDVQKDEPVGDFEVRRASMDPTASSLVVMMELLDQIMQRIPDKHREILRLRLEEFSIDEIAAAVRVSSRTVDRALSMVRQVAAELIAANSVETE